MSKPRFTDADIAEAIGAFVAATPPRIAPVVGRNGDVKVYGENKNPYKPVISKGEDDGADEKISGIDIGIAPEGADGLGDSQGV